MCVRVTREPHIIRFHVDRISFVHQSRSKSIRTRTDKRGATSASLWTVSTDCKYLVFHSLYFFRLFAIRFFRSWRLSGEPIGVASARFTSALLRPLLNYISIISYKYTNGKQSYVGVHIRAVYASLKH